MAIETLQWGRDVIVADAPTIISKPKKADSLQWGRDVIVADASSIAAMLG